MGAYTALRISGKTGKPKTVALNRHILGALKQYYPHRRGDFIFANNRKKSLAISRVQAWRIIRNAAAANGLTGRK